MIKLYRGTLTGVIIFALVVFISHLACAQGKKGCPIPEEDWLADPTQVRLGGGFGENHAVFSTWITKWYGPDGNYENNGGFAASAPKDLISEGTNDKLTQPKLSTLEGLKSTQTIGIEWAAANGGTRGWTVFEIDPTDAYNMDRDGPGSNIDMYAICVIVTPKAMKAVMSPAHDDHAQIWINGEKWYNNSQWTGGAQHVNHNIEVQLVKGANVLLYRCGESAGHSYMNLHFDAETHRVADFYPNNATDQASFFAEIAVATSSITEQVSGDVNGDGVVSLEDIAAVCLGRTGENRADINKDGVVDAADLLLIAAVVTQADAAPSLSSVDLANMFTAAEVRQWLRRAREQGLTGVAYQRGLLLLEQLLRVLTPGETLLLANYPNPFNPETWIPYQLSEPASVTLTLYDLNGQVVRILALGHQPAGIYQSRSRAAYWDGRNALGESVASGVYFYTLEAGDFIATQKMLIRK